MARPHLNLSNPYTVKAFGNLVIPKDWLFYTSLPYLLAKAGNEDALQDLVDIVTRVRRSRGNRYYGILEGKEMPNLSGITRDIRRTGT